MIRSKDKQSDYKVHINVELTESKLSNVEIFKKCNLSSMQFLSSFAFDDF